MTNCFSCKQPLENSVCVNPLCRWSSIDDVNVYKETIQKLLEENLVLQKELTDLFELVEKHGTRTMLSHATQLMRTRKVIYDFTNRSI